MIVKFLPTRNGGGLGSVNYLLNERKQQGTARILKGDENTTRAIISQIPYKQKTTFGVLSFSEKADTIDDKTKQEIIADFERTLLGDYMKERVNILWVEHSDKNGRLELNFLIPKIDLESGKSFNPYYAKRDQFNIDLWKRTINDEYKLTNPNDPSRQHEVRAKKKNLEQYNTITELNEALKQLVADGAIKSREHLIETLNAKGYEVTRANKNGISVKLPNQKRSNRLQGGIYDEQFTDISKLSELSEEKSRRIRKFAERDTFTECQINRSKINENIRRRDEYNQRKYSKYDKRSIRNNHTKSNQISYKWSVFVNSSHRHSARIFNQQFALQERITILSNANQQPTTAEQPFREMANSAEYERQPNQRENQQGTQGVSNYSEPNERSELKRRNESLFLSTEQGGIDDTARKRIIERSRAITRASDRIADENNQRARREKEARNREREFAERQHKEVLQRLRERFLQEQREIIIRLQERARKFRERFKRIRELTERIKSNFDKLQGQFRENGLQAITERIRSIKDGLCRFRDGIHKRINSNISETDKRYGGKFRARLESETKRATSACGFEIERELRKPERQQLVELTREKQRQRQRLRHRGPTLGF